MQIIIPMGGVGRRFIDRGYADPKPLIKVDGKPIIQHIVERYPGERDFLFVCKRTDLEKTPLRKVLEGIAPGCVIVGIPPNRLGPVFTTLQAERFVKENVPVIVNYCDFDWTWDYGLFKRFLRETKCDGCVPGYTGFHPHLLRGKLYAGIRHDEDGRMLEIREKHRFTEDPMGTFHSSGTYYFRRGALLKRYFAEAMRLNLSLKGEFYVSTVYSLLLRDGLDVRVFPLPHFCQWGEPEDLEEYLRWSEAFHEAKAHELVANGRSDPRTYEYWRTFFKSTIRA